jgi:hypothetical protein
MRRILMAAAAATAIAIPASVAVAGTSSPAFAASSLSCAKASGTESSVTIGKCSPLTRAEKKGYKTGTTAASLASGGPITWSNSGTQTVLSAPAVTFPTDTCKKPTQNTEVTATGTVTGGNAAVTTVGDTYSATFCVNTTTGVVTLLKGTTFTM